jgi:hypothetical protein
MTNTPIKLGFTPAEFSKYVAELKPNKFLDTGAKIEGMTLHNTWSPDLKRVRGYLDSKRWTPEQLMDNWWVSYRKMKWRSGPHIFIFPNGKIYVATKLTERGTHSPSYNAARFGIEVIGNFDTETLPDDMRQLTVHAFATLYRALGKRATTTNFNFHGEDPRTSHKACPGKNIGTKAQWIADINADIDSEKHK